MKMTKWFGTMIAATALSVTAFASSSEASVYEKFDRISGSDRYETAIQVSREGWTANSTDNVVLVIGDNYPDALAGAPLAKKLNAPILLVKKDTVPASIMSEIGRLGAKNATILGGEIAISNQVVKQLESKGINVDRIAGSSRSETSALIAKEVGGTSAIVASGSGYADSLSIASHAAETGKPILLTSGKELSREVEQALKNYEDVTVVGGEVAVSSAVYNKIGQSAKVQRISGKDRYATAAAVVAKLYPKTIDDSLVASGQQFADALTGSALGGKQNKPILLVKQSALPSQTKDIINNKNVQKLTVIGGEVAVSKEALNPNPKPAPIPVVKPSVDIRSNIIDEAKKHIGTPYRWGGTTTSGFDCSGYLMYVFNKNGISIPRTTALMAQSGKPVSYSNVKVGDIVLLDLVRSTPTRPSHAGIYIGDGKIIHAGTSTGVTITPLDTSWGHWDKKIVTIRSYTD
ncbi:cell wall-binding repeat-containing protein [Planococcus sp. 11815]|uniref:Putative cell wall-binding protein n=3 Tax=Caryophanaceae TaxID=186818 RepID=A0A497YID5_9BACL|nr:putative cell wall-binding protein [Planococcus citreus]